MPIGPKILVSFARPSMFTRTSIQNPDAPRSGRAATGRLIDDYYHFKRLARERDQNDLWLNDNIICRRFYQLRTRPSAENTPVQPFRTRSTVIFTRNSVVTGLGPARARVLNKNKFLLFHIY